MENSTSKRVPFLPSVSLYWYGTIPFSNPYKIPPKSIEKLKKKPVVNQMTAGFHARFCTASKN